MDDKASGDAYRRADRYQSSINILGGIAIGITTEGLSTAKTRAATGTRCGPVIGSDGMVSQVPKRADPPSPGSSNHPGVFQAVRQDPQQRHRLETGAVAPAEAN